MDSLAAEKLPYRLWDLTFRVSGEILAVLGWPPFRRFVDAQKNLDLTAELHGLADDMGLVYLQLAQSDDPEARDDAAFISDVLYPVRALVLLLYDRNQTDRERHFQRLCELISSSQLLREIDYARGIGRWLMVRALHVLAQAAAGRADDQLFSTLRADDEEARERILDRLGGRVLLQPGRWRELGAFIHGERNQLLTKLGTPPKTPQNLELGASVLDEVLKPFSHLGSLYQGPNIPEKKLRTARKFCEVPDEENVLALVDCTVFGSASDAVLFGSRHVFFRNFISQDGRPGRISYADLLRTPIHRSSEGELVLGDKLVANPSGSGLSAADLLCVLRDLVKWFSGHS